MDIRCPQCDTLYEFDESRLQSGSATLKCRKCQHMFRLGEDAQPSREDERRWMVRDPRSGDVLYFSGFDQLHEWIVERKVDRQWQISRTGDKWKTLGDIGEFRPIFQVVDNVSDLESQDAVREEVEETPESGRSKRDTLNQFDNKSTGSSDPARSEPADQSGVDATATARGGEGAVDDEPTEPSGGPVDRSSSSMERRRRESSDVGRQRQSSPRAREVSSGAQAAVDGASASSVNEAGSTSAATRGGESDASTSRDVNLDTDQFGDTADEESSDEDWTFEDEPDLDEEIEFSAGSRGPSGGVLAGVVGVLVLALAGYMFAFERERLSEWTGIASGDRTVTMGDAGGADAEEGAEGPSEAFAKGVGGVEKAFREARRRAGEREASIFSDAAGEAATGLYEARSAASERADAAAEEESKRSMADLLKAANEAVQNGQTSEGRRLYQNILERDSSNSEALTGVGWTYLSDGRSEIAVRKFKRALEINPNFGDAYIGLGHAQRNLGNKQQALEAYQSYLDKLPGGSKSSIAEYQAKQLKKDLGK